MLKTEIYCKTTSPLFMAGVDKNEPEIRATGIKGVMRYIWRATQCAEDLRDLRDKEGKLFGNADGDNTRVSPWRMQVITENCNAGRNDMLPYRSGSERGGRLSAPSIAPGSSFTVRIIGGSGETQHQSIVRLFVLTCMLGGFGRRSRKGMGTVTVERIDGTGREVSAANTIDNCLSLLNHVAERDIYILDENESLISGTRKGRNYPYIEKVMLYRSLRGIRAGDLQKIIGDAAHNNKRDNPWDKFLGSAKPRFASSLLISTIPSARESFDCIVTQLYCTEDPVAKNRDNFLTLLSGEVKR